MLKLKRLDTPHVELARITKQAGRHHTVCLISILSIERAGSPGI